MKVVDVFDTLDYGPAPESAAPAYDWLDSNGRQFGLFIDGAWREPAAGEHFDTIDPATAEPLARIAHAGADDVDAAVVAARAAFDGWRSVGGHARARYLYAIARHVQRHSRQLAVLETLDTGKPIRESRDIDIPLVARHFYHHAGWAQLTESEFAGHEPLGVVGQIIPWNSPLLMLAWKIAPALATGNTVVLKPAELTPLTALRFAGICEEVGLPPGVVNIVTGDGRTGELLAEHDDVDGIAFTGSPEIGRSLREAAAGSGKKLCLQLGGSSPFLVFDDADLDSVVEGVVDAISAGTRILVHEGTAERMTDRLRARMERLRVGDPLDKSVDIGAIAAPVQLERIDRLVRQGIADGGVMWQPSWSPPAEGCFYPPTLFTDVSPASTIAQGATFGPVVMLMTFRTHDEAVALANNTRYGLAASVWTESVNLALDIAPRIRAGTVWINSTNLFDAASGFGGHRESGFGREGGREGLLEYLRPSWQAARTTRANARAGEAPAPTMSTRGAGEPPAPRAASGGVPPIDRTFRLYIGGRQVRPESGYSLAVRDHSGSIIGEVGQGSRKDVRNAVEAAHASTWPARSAHHRAQVLYYLAENLATRRPAFVERLAMTGTDDSASEFDLAIERLFLYAAWADKWDGRMHSVPQRMVTLAMHEPVGVLGVVCADDAGLLGFVSAIAPALALGNTVIAIPGEIAPLIATDFYQVVETSDVPAGALAIITGRRSELVPTLAAHDDVDGIWYFADDALQADVERLGAGNMKRTWLAPGRDWSDSEQGAGEEFLRHATEVKNVWIPYGE